MPIITEDQACREHGIAPAECKALTDASNRQLADARLACVAAFSDQAALKATCFVQCGGTSLNAGECAAAIRIANAEQTSTAALVGHILIGILIALAALTLARKRLFRPTEA